MFRIKQDGQTMKVASLYVGSVIGAGFASGQEILQFFVVYGLSGLLGSILAGFAFGYFGARILILASQYHAASYKELFEQIAGRKMTKILDILSLIILQASLIIMLAGSGAVFKEHLGCSAVVGVGVSLIISVAVLFAGLDGLLNFSALIVPVKVLILITIALIATLSQKNITEQLFPLVHNSGNWVFSSLLYVSYNLVLPMGVLSSLGKYINYTRAFRAGWIGGLALGFCVLVVAISELVFFLEITKYQVPMVIIASKLGPIFRLLSIIIMWAALMTTIISNTHAIAVRLAPAGSFGYRLYGLISLMLAVPFSKYDFIVLVKTIYPCLGYAGFIIVFLLVKQRVLEYVRRN